MLTLHLLSPQDEAHLARALAREIEAAWPEVVADPHDRIDLLVGVRAGVDVDLLIALDFETPRELPRTRAPGGFGALRVGSGLIAAEIKQLDATRFERIGDQLFALYPGKMPTRSVSDQARDAAHGVKSFASSSGFADLYVHALAWLTQLDRAQLDGVDPTVVGAGTFADLLVAACRQHASLSRENDRTTAGVRAVRDRLLLRRTMTPLDRLKTERIARDTIVRELVAEIAPHAGRAPIQLRGHGGSGKTTALVLLATRLATQYGARVLVLTFHHALRGDIEHVLTGMPEAAGLLGSALHVETATSFLLALVEAAGGTVPRDAAGAIDYTRTDDAYAEVSAALGPHVEGGHAADVVAEDRDRFAWDHVLIDESQDWTDAERDLLLAAYGARRVVLADGLVQLMRRQSSCDWMRDVPRGERVVRHLGDSLRMQHNVAVFANAVARTMGFSNWSVTPRAELVGGRIVVLEGELDDGAALVAAIGAYARRGKAAPVDNLICVPHSQIVRSAGGGRRAGLALACEAAGERVWDACDPLTRTLAPESAEAWRIVQYDSCRGLEGWTTLLVALDDLYANRLKHPNVGVSAGPPVDPEVVARRWLLIPLTRAVHCAIVHVRDPHSPVAAIVREAAATMPKGVVEVCAARDGAAAIASSASVRTG